MSWNNAGPPVDLAPGQSVFWEYSWKDNEDKGLELAGPNFLDIAPGNLGTLVASNQGKRLEGFGKNGGAAVTYVVTITNIDSSEHATHNLQGGVVS